MAKNSLRKPRLTPSLLVAILVLGIFDGSRCKADDAMPSSANPAEQQMPAPDASGNPVSPSPRPVREVPKKTGWTAKVIRKSLTPPISELSLPNKEIPVTLMPKNGKLRPLVELHGQYERPGWNLYVQSPAGKMRVKFQGKDFTVYAYLNSQLSDFTFLAQGPNNETETEQVMLFSPDAQEYRIGKLWGDLVLSLGGASFSYFETTFGQFASKSGIVAASYTSPAIGRWGIISELQLPIWTVSSAPINVGPELLQAKLAGTYLVFPDRGKGFKGFALLGINYLTLLSNGSPFGFANLIATNFGFRAHYGLPKDNSLIGEIHYVPINGWITSACGYDLSVGVRHTLTNLHRVEFNINYSHYSYFPESSFQIETGLLSFRFGYSI